MDWGKLISPREAVNDGLWNRRVVVNSRIGSSGIKVVGIRARSCQLWRRPWWRTAGVQGLAKVEVGMGNILLRDHGTGEVPEREDQELP